MQLIEGRDLDWHDLMATAKPVDPVPVAATDPLYVLYTSGTTGTPKGIVRDNGGHAVALLWSMRHIYDMHPGEVFWAASDVGWVVGHSYIVYGPLLLGATTVLYEGKPVGTPDPGAFWRVAAEHHVKVLFTAPTAIRAIRKEDPDGTYIGRHDLTALKYLFLAGERLDPDTYHWALQKLGIPIVDHWWQTETGWAIAANPMGVEALPFKAGSPTVPMPGYDVHILHADGDRCEPGEEGVVCLRLPLPPGTLPTLWGDDARYQASYLCEHPGYYLTGDGGYLDDDGYLFVMGRVDDVINVAGHRLSTGAIESVLATHPRGGRVRGDRRRRRDQGPGSARPGGAESRRIGRRPRRRTGEVRPRRDRSGGVFQARRRRRGATEDSLGQDTAQDDARHRPRQGRTHALDDRGSLPCSTHCDRSCSPPLQGE